MNGKAPLVCLASKDEPSVINEILYMIRNMHMKILHLLSEVFENKILDYGAVKITGALHTTSASEFLDLLMGKNFMWS